MNSLGSTQQPDASQRGQGLLDWKAGTGIRRGYSPALAPGQVEQQEPALSSPSVVVVVEMGGGGVSSSPAVRPD